MSAFRAPVTREDVADLRAGDVVEIVDTDHDVTARGPLRVEHGNLYFGNNLVRFDRDDTRDPGGWLRTGRYRLTVVEKAKPPLYINHHRTYPVAGDVARAADDDSDACTYVRDVESSSYGWWLPTKGSRRTSRQLPKPLRLLVDGETGQVVP